LRFVYWHHGVGQSLAQPVLGVAEPWGGNGTSDKAWVTEQTGLFATNKLDVRVEKHTQLNGGVLNSATGQLTLDTGTLGFKDIQDHDRGSSISGQVGLSYASDRDVDGDGVVDKDSGGPGGTVSGSYASHDEQVAKATVGESTITVRNEAKQKQEVAALNRDATQAQVITKDHREGVQVYVSDTSIKAAAEGLQVVGRALGTV
jgi:filamentous hemagglutinin